MFMNRFTIGFISLAILFGGLCSLHWLNAHAPSVAVYVGSAVLGYMFIMAGLDGHRVLPESGLPLLLGMLGLALLIIPMPLVLALADPSVTAGLAKAAAAGGFLYLLGARPMIAAHDGF
jgi:hypothetical protein